ncbi:MAG: glycosyltransferase family 39 protein [Thermoguttaceae bacterium]|nr:glycosyltransferase family 39 protein [Thermoguttaceae bacterium]
MPNVSKKIAFCLLLAIFIVTRLVLNVYTPLMDPSEARYAVFAKNMTQSENWWQPTYNYEGVETVFVGKPPLAFQMSMACCKALGISEFATRLPAFISSLLILWLVWIFVKKWRDAQSAAYAVLLTCCSFLFYMYAGQTMTDLILTAAVVGAIFSYVGFERSCEYAYGGRVLPAKKQSTFDIADNVRSPETLKTTAYCLLPTVYSVLFFVFIALGVLVKGPVAIVMAGLPVFFYVLINNTWKNMKYHAWVLGTVAFLAIVVPYYWIVSVKHPDFLQYFIIEENFNRFLFKGSASRFGTARESFYGVSFLWFLVLNLPTVFLMQLLPSENRKKMYVWSLFKDPLTGMSALTCISLTLFWALTSRVLITYLLPTIPFFAVFLAVRFRDSGLLDQPGFSKALNAFVTSWLILLPVLFSSAVYVSVFHTAEMASPIIADAVKEIEKNPDFAERNYYFAELSPHYAEYYYKEKTQFHVPESVKNSLNNSKNDWLFITQSQTSGFGEPINRKLVFQKGQWSLYAPLETDVPQNQSDNVEKSSTDVSNN